MTPPFKLGLTGSIGMGKSTTAKMFQDEGCDLWDADAAVHRLYSGTAVPQIAEAFPDAIVDGVVSRDRLREMMSKDRSVLPKLEAIVHPLVARDREAFCAQAKGDVLVFDIPLLFETGAEKTMDGTVCVDVDEATQEARVLARGTMTRAQFLAIREKQMPNAEKCARADFVIITDTLEHARAQVQTIVEAIRAKFSHA